MTPFFKRLAVSCDRDVFRPLHYQGVAMVISTTAFGVYFSLMSEIHDPTAGEPQNNLAWLALASIAVFITGESLHFQARLFILKAIGVVEHLLSVFFYFFFFKKFLVLQLITIIICYGVQVLLSAGVRSHGWSCRKFSPSK